MLTITTAIKYKPVTAAIVTMDPSKRLPLKEKRALRQKQGVCIGCGRSRPCEPCADRTRRWKLRQKQERLNAQNR